MLWRRQLFVGLQSLHQGAPRLSLLGSQSPQLALAGANELSPTNGDSLDVPSSLRELGDLLSDTLWLAVPKSKVSPSRKRMKWKQHIPKPIGWSRCERCGEAKRPHRICTKNANICAMREEEFLQHLRTKSDGME
jgi:large subunit ribosomal protein L32